MAKKKWGQHFLKSRSIAESIVQAADVQHGDHILEIGPGYGILTQALLNFNARVTAIEIDPDLCAKLRKKFFIIEKLLGILTSASDRDHFQQIQGELTSFGEVNMIIHGKLFELCLEIFSTQAALVEAKVLVDSTHELFELFEVELSVAVLVAFAVKH